MLKRFFAIVIVGVMLLSSFSASVSAKEYNTPFPTNHPNYWQSDGTRNYGVLDPNHYIEQDEDFLARKLESANWIIEALPELFLLDGEIQIATDDDITPVPGNYILYDVYTLEAEDVPGLVASRAIIEKYTELLSFKSTEKRIDCFDVWDKEAKELLASLDKIDYSEVEKITNAASVNTEAYKDKAVFEAYSKTVGECASAKDSTGKISLNLYLKLYKDFYKLCQTNVLYGDVDCDGTVTANDATVVLQAFSKIKELNANQRCLIGDSVNATTATKMLQVFSKIADDYEAPKLEVDNPSYKYLNYFTAPYLLFK